MKYLLSSKPSVYLLILFFSIPLLSFINQEAGWVQVTLDPKVKVSFPRQPSNQIINGMQVYMARSTDGIYMSMSIAKALRDDQTAIKDVQQFYLGFMDSIIRNAKATLQDSSSFSINGHKGIKFSYLSVQPDGSKIVRINRSILVTDNLFALSYTPLQPPTESAQKVANKFLESIEVSK